MNVESEPDALSMYSLTKMSHQIFRGTIHDSLYGRTRAHEIHQPEQRRSVLGHLLCFHLLIGTPDVAQSKHVHRVHDAEPTCSKESPSGD